MIVQISPARYILEFNFEEELGERTKREGGIVAFDNNVGSNQKTVVPFFATGRHKESVVHQLSQSYVDLSKRTERKAPTKVFYLNEL